MENQTSRQTTNLLYLWLQKSETCDGMIFLIHARKLAILRAFRAAEALFMIYDVW